MAGKKSRIGPTGETVADNVTRLREEKNLTYAELSRRLAAAGQPIPELGLRNIEKLQRKIDADELMALAVVLGTTPNDLLTPESAVDSDTTEVQASGLPKLPALHFRSWMKEGNEKYLDPDFDFKEYRRDLMKEMQERLEWIDSHFPPELIEQASEQASVSIQEAIRKHFYGDD